MSSKDCNCKNSNGAITSRTAADVTSPSAAVQKTMLNNPPTNPLGFQFEAAKQVTDPRLKTLPTRHPKNMRLSAVASNTVDGAPSIVEMARALKGTASGATAVGQIFEFVYNNIEWIPGWGLQKGALGCLMDGMGTQFDQSQLLASLLRQAGFTANIVMGKIRLTEAQYQAWWDVLDIWTAQNYCFNTFLPVATAPTWTGSNWYMDIKHVWVQVVISGTTYVLDPSYKTYSRISGMSSSALASAMGYSQSTFLSDAQSGATVTTDYVQNMNSANVNSDLKTFTANLVSYIKTNTIGSAPAGTATVDDILGGQTIVPVTLPLTLSTSLSYEMPGDTPTVWTGGHRHRHRHRQRPAVLSVALHEVGDQRERGHVDAQTGDQADVHHHRHQHGEHQADLLARREVALQRHAADQRAHQRPAARADQHQADVEGKVAGARAVVGPADADAQAVGDDQHADHQQQKGNADLRPAVAYDALGAGLILVRHGHSLLVPARRPAGRWW